MSNSKTLDQQNTDQLKKLTEILTSAGAADFDLSADITMPTIQQQQDVIAKATGSAKVRGKGAESAAGSSTLSSALNGAKNNSTTSMPFNGPQISKRNLTKFFLDVR